MLELWLGFLWVTFMRIENLTKYGFSRRIVDCWRESGLDFLLPLQVEALKDFGLLQGNNVLINGPTSSGKTFCGELAAVRSVMNNKRAIFLVPLKALASEKFWELKKRYRKIGFKVIAVTSDYPGNKRLFVKGTYDIAVVVYEMFNSLTVNGLSLLESVGTIIFDELQLVTTTDRGLAYELAISKVRNISSSIQMIGLIGGLDECRLFSEWLNISLLKSTNRPVELYQGVLFGGKFFYRRYNDCREGLEYFKGTDIILQDCDIPIELYRGVKHLVDKDEQVLIFTATRNGCVNLAVGLAELLSLSAVNDVLNMLDDIPDTVQKGKLLSCLQKGVGFHNADLGLSSRRILEAGFRSGELKVMVSTSTLAMGVNFPSKNVFIEAVKCYDGYDGRPILKPLVMYDYNQLAGRAGRFGHTDDFGRAIVIADDETRREVLWDSYVYGSAHPKVEPFDIEKLANLLLRWTSCGLVKDYDDIRNMFANTLRGYCEKYGDWVPQKTIDILVEHGFLKFKGCRFYCTELGKATARHNIFLNTAILIKDGFGQHGLSDNFLSWIYYLIDTPDGQKLILKRLSISQEKLDIVEPLSHLLDLYSEKPSGQLAVLVTNPEIPVDQARVATFSLIAEMIQPLPTMELETKYDIGWGRIKHIGEGASNLMQAVVDIGGYQNLDDKQRQKLHIYAERLFHCLTEEGLTLALLKVPLLERDYILRLNSAGMFTPSDIINAGFDAVSSIVPERVANNLYKICQDILSEKSTETINKPLPGSRALRARKAGSRYEVEIGGMKVLLQPKLYSYLFKLYNADKLEGWLDKSFLDHGSNQVKYIYKLKKALESVPGVAVESDGSGRYRLVLPGDTGKLRKGIDVSRVITDKKVSTAYRRS